MLLFACCALTYAQQPTEEQKKKPASSYSKLSSSPQNWERPEIPESPTTIAEVTAEQLQLRSVANIGQALELLPGVQFRVARSKSEEQVTIRGFEQEKVLILMDGIPISLPYEGQINLADIPVQNIASIKLIKGIGSVLYGANGMGGVINVITKRGTKSQVSRLNTREASTPLTIFRWGTAGKKDRSVTTLHLATGRAMAILWRNFDSLPGHPEQHGFAPRTLPACKTPIPPDEHSRDNGLFPRNAFTFTGTLALGSKNTLAFPSSTTLTIMEFRPYRSSGKSQEGFLLPPLLALYRLEPHDG